MLIILFVIFRYKLKEFTIEVTRIDYDETLIIKNTGDNCTENNIDDQIKKSPVNQTCNECYKVS